MKRSSAELKKLAREALPGKFGTLIGTYAIYGVIALTANIIISILFPSSYSQTNSIIHLCIQLILSFIWTVFGAGFIFQSLKVCRGETIGIGDLFYGFSHHPDKFIVIALLQTLITILFFVPGFILMYIAGISSSAFFAFFIPGLLVILVGYVAFFIVFIGLSLCYYLIIDNPEMTALNSFGESWKLMKGHKGRLFYLSLSFVGLTLLGMLSAGIGMLWVTPYMNITSAYFYLDIIGELNPVVPVQPVAIMQPGAPTQPVAPVQPVAPTQPVAPIQPVAPAQPIAPSQPVVPTQPIIPQPDAPVIEPEVPADDSQE